MAQRVITQLIDDIDGSSLEPGEGETVEFAIDGVNYEIDLTKAHARALRDAFSPFTKAARRTTAPKRGGRPRAVRTVNTDADPQAVRKWAEANGKTVSSRGRVPASIVAEFKAAGN